MAEAAQLTARHLEDIEERGYAVLEGVIESDLVDALSEALLKIERDRDIRPADNDFEGSRTVRIYNLLAYGAPFDRVPIHPGVLPVVEGVLDKILEEVKEIKQAANEEELSEEIGDLFFVLVKLARWKKIDAESALRETNLKFKRRFGYVEQGARGQGRSLSDMTLEEMDVLWEEAKGAKSS